MTKYELLAWDTNFFGFPVAKIVRPRLVEEELKSILEELKSREVSLVYWPSDSKDKESQLAAKRCGGFLADRKMTYVTELKEKYLGEMAFLTGVEEYKKDETTEDLNHLALLSGIYSRYNLDPKISQRQFEDLYKIWIEKSVKKKIADAVLVIRVGKRIVGMITLCEKNKRGDIGLLAVDVPVRRKGFGTALVRAAQAWFVNKNYKIGQVVTQERNMPARKLYEKCGYRVEKIENFYHFWL
ncbi:MAG TPA: GNAT family N-acetyltransferase [Thermoplasmata archaeon]|nr:GNAT family N-acetyltransferase [Thermoplasmata archaeon]